MLANLTSIAASLNAQQIKLDVTANNIANINSTAYKKNRVTFGDMLYNSAYAPGVPVSENVRCGEGVMVSGNEKDFSSGLLMDTGRQLDLAVDGEGFFGVLLPDGTLELSRDGHFFLDGDQYLVNAQGAVVYTDMVLPPDYSEVVVTDTGEIRAQMPDGQWTPAGNIPLFYVPNPSGLQTAGTGLYRETDASGAVSQGTAGDSGFGKIRQGYLEQPNVELAEEMVNLIVAQRSFQFSCRAMGTLDDMWGLANNLQR